VHIPDGFVSPATYIAGTALAVPLLAYAYKKTKGALTDESFALVSSLTAFSFVIMMFNIPIPGGTSGHAVGMGILAILFGPWVAAFCVSVTLFIQALVFADGGITVFGINSISMGFVGSFAAYYAYKALSGRINEKAALFISGWFAIVAASVVVALVLGIQPSFGLDEQGRPLYFPFALDVTLPAVVGSHALFFGMVEGIATALVVAFVKKLGSVNAKAEAAQ
jgi:cobalt/nickel transport system permease protein